MFLLVLAALAVMLLLAVWTQRPDPTAIPTEAESAPPPVEAESPLIVRQPKNPEPDGNEASRAPGSKSTYSKIIGRIGKGTKSIEDEIKLALQHGSRSTRVAMLQEIATRLAETDLDRATSLLEEILSSPKTQHAAAPFTKSMILEFVDQDPELALSWSDSLPDSMRNLARDTAIESWITSDPLAAAKWISDMPEAELRQAYTEQVALKFLNEPASSSATTWAKNLAYTPDASNHINNIARIWARDDLAAASEWAQGLPDPGAQTTATVGVASILADRGLEAVVDWVGQLPNEDGYRDEAIMFIAYDLDGKHNGMGLELAKKFNHIYASERAQSGPNSPIPPPSQ